MKLLKTISLFTFLFFINTISFGQYFGLKAGFDFPYLKAEHEIIGAYNHQNKNINMHFAIIFDYEINSKLTFMPAINYVTKSMAATNGFTTTYQLTYLEFPLLAKYFPSLKFNKNKNLKFYGLAGPYVSLGRKGRFQFNQSTPKDVWSGPAQNFRLKRFDYGFIYGVGVHYKFAQIELFHSLGLPDISTSFEGLVSAKHRNFGISVAYFIVHDRTDY